MSAVHETLHQSDHLARVNLSEYIAKLADSFLKTYIGPGRDFRVFRQIPPIRMDLQKSYPFGLILNELITNAAKHAFPHGEPGEIGIIGEEKGENAVFVVSDKGVGLPRDLDWRNSETLGLKLVKNLVESQLQGRLELETSGGTKWTITFPI